jgi:hypothetical protein
MDLLVGFNHLPPAFSSSWALEALVIMQSCRSLALVSMNRNLLTEFGHLLPKILVSWESLVFGECLGNQALGFSLHSLGEVSLLHGQEQESTLRIPVLAFEHRIMEEEFSFHNYQPKESNHHSLAWEFGLQNWMASVSSLHS